MPDLFDIGRKALRINWGLVLLICVTAAIGVGMQYSAADGAWDPWARRHLARFGIVLVVLFAVAVVDLRIWLRHAYTIYGLFLVILASVEFAGLVGMGARRWIDFGPVTLQPSELMKIGLVLALARYFHDISFDKVRLLPYLIVPLALVAAPCVLVLRQPDLGTALFLILIGGAMCFLAGVRLWIFGSVIAAAALAMPLVFRMLRPYQQERILTFLNPESDPHDAGYHIQQSKIAFGSGGVTGKGFLNGSQSHLDFLPERHTDFIFTMLAEEFGLAGSLALLFLYVLILVYGLAIGLRSRNHFGSLIAAGVTSMLFCYVFINVAMVLGLIPVVGVPLPLVSHGGTAMLAVMIGLGLIVCVNVHHDLTDLRTDAQGWQLRRRE